jgi:hypothetical protein
MISSMMAARLGGSIDVAWFASGATGQTCSVAVLV